MITRLFRRMRIRQKLVAMIMMTSAIVLTIASGAYIVWEYYRSRGEMTRDLAVEGRLIVENTTAALQFRDPKTARETLQTLAVHRSIRAACLNDAAGAPFASYLVPDARPCPPRSDRDRAAFSGDGLEVFQSSIVEGRQIGALYLRSDLAALTERVRLQSIAVALLLLMALAVAWLLSSYLQSIVATPVTGLARTAANVSSRGDYSIRAEKTTDDELGELVDAFNHMLQRIQERESDLSRANEELRHEIAERQRAEQERALLLVREREANRLKDEFLATLSHELRTPLNAILGWTRLLRANALAPGASDRALEKVERNAQVQARLVEDLLDVSRITTGKLRLELQPVDLVALLNSAIESIRPAAEARDVRIEPDIDAFALPTVGDPDRLQQIVWNLLSNAVKFTQPGGRVTVRLSRKAGIDELVVADTGVGIAPEFLPSVFDTFRQADASSTRQHGGLGLGLSIVRRLVEMHGGHVHAESDGPNHGATFIVRLPTRQVDTAPEGDEAPTVAAATGGALHGHRILVVDDEPDTREMLASALGSAGAAVKAAGSADEALRLAVEWRPDVLVSDIGMPGVDGYSLMEQLRATLDAEGPRVAIALTAYAGENDRRRALAVGYQHHIAKPIDPLALARTIREMLDARTA